MPQPGELSPTCKRGHEWTPENTGRDGRGRRRCLTCKRVAAREWKRQVRNGVTEPLPAAPLIELLRPIARDNARAAKCVERMRGRGTVTANLADRYCCELLNMHPAEVYGDLWWQVAEGSAA